MRCLNQDMHSFSSHDFHSYNGNSQSKGRTRASPLQNSSFQLTAYALNSKNKALKTLDYLSRRKGGADSDGCTLLLCLVCSWRLPLLKGCPLLRWLRDPHTQRAVQLPAQRYSVHPSSDAAGCNCRWNDNIPIFTRGSCCNWI